MMPMPPAMPGMRLIAAGTILGGLLAKRGAARDPMDIREDVRIAFMYADELMQQNGAPK